MQSILTKNFGLKPKNQQTNYKTPKRNIEVVCGPPRFPMSLGRKVGIGGGMIVLMMAIPIWGLLSLPSWAIKHANLGKANLQSQEQCEEVPPEKK